MATQNRRNLRQAGFEEAYLINSGENRNAISLGLFSSEANAKSLFDEISTAGFEPVMGGRTETVAHHWVDYKPDGGIDAPWKIITRRDPLIGRHSIACFAAPAPDSGEEAGASQPGPEPASVSELGTESVLPAADAAINSEETSAPADRQPTASEPAPAESQPEVSSPEASGGDSSGSP